MPIEPKRIEAAARALVLLGQAYRSAGQGLPTRLQEAEAALAAAWPELASDPPTAWVAPVTPSEAMFDSVVRATNSQMDIDDDMHGDLVSIAGCTWDAFRDAYTKEQT